MDKRWIDYKTARDRSKEGYHNGVGSFLNIAFERVGGSGKIRCPFNNCNNGAFLTREEVFNHLIIHGMLKSYEKWDFHGEYDENEKSQEIEEDDEVGIDETISMIHDATNIRDAYFMENGDEIGFEIMDNEDMRETFARLMKDANTELFPGCEKYSKLEFIVDLLHLKCINSWSNASFTMLLKLLKQVFLDDKNFPSNAYEAKKYSRDLGLNYVKIDACKNDCILYPKRVCQLPTMSCL
ncbi:hypothetical protein M5689_024945 [Euphorbia peplus]|nr:hypothetical protein M5689_024945 [Euphorbia peplus]